ncbi:MAG: FecR family protein [Candidatus Sericytochromatia bacterium]
MKGIIKFFISIAIASTMTLPVFAKENDSFKIASVGNIQRDAMIVRIATGQAQKKTSDNNWIPIAIGGDLATSDIVKTGKNSTILVELPENSGFIRILPETEIRVDQIKIDKTLGGGQIAELSILKGKVITKVRKFNRKSSKLQINTKGATAAVRGTSFLTSYDENENTKIVVGDGKVAVKAQDNEVMVKPQETTTVSLGSTPTTPMIVSNKLDFSISELTAEKDMLKISGNTDSESEVSLNKASIYPNNDGTFTGVFNINEGKNNLEVKSSTIDGRTKIAKLKVIKLTD